MKRVLIFLAGVIAGVILYRWWMGKPLGQTYGTEHEGKNIDFLGLTIRL
jgi:hypothetical protein